MNIADFFFFFGFLIERKFGRINFILNEKFGARWRFKKNRNLAIVRGRIFK